MKHSIEQLKEIINELEVVDAKEENHDMFFVLEDIENRLKTITNHINEISLQLLHARNSAIILRNQRRGN